MSHDRNHRLCTLYLKRKRRRAKRAQDQETVDAISAILDDELACCALCCELEDQVASQQLIGAGRFAFLAWLLQNWPAIMELIKQLIELFKTEPAE